MKLRVAAFLLLVCLSVVVFSCRRNQPSLVDSNRPPDTELWYAPLDSTEYEWNVHLYWRGVDVDGIAVRYIWTITDTLEANPLLRWNPSERIVDYRQGRVTGRTDSVIAFTAFKNVAGVGLRKNRQAFHVAAIDDNGVIDPTPAVVEFIATVAQLPRVAFNLTLTTVEREGAAPTTETRRYNPAVLDTLGMFRPMAISYRGSTTNGLITGYKYYPLTVGVTLPGQDVWNPDLTDTLRYFSNEGEEALPSGVFRFIAQCGDQSGAESRADVKTFTEGVVQVVVNYEPDTEIYQVENTYFIAGQSFKRFINFKDDIPDTVPYASWIRIDYRGWDNRRDSTVCVDDLNSCIHYQVQFERGSAQVPGSNYRTRWLPGQPEDTNCGGTPDSTTINIGSADYRIRARAVDEFEKPDGTMFDPATGEPKSEIKITGNHRPTLDLAVIQNYDGTTAPADGDTIVWDWWAPANYTGLESDTLKLDLETGKYFVEKIFYLDLNATGHDHPTENLRFGLRGWNYLFLRTDTMETESFFGGAGWREGTVRNIYTQRFKALYRYERDGDPGGASIFAEPPSFWNREYEFSIYGRDIPLNAEFEEYMFSSTGNQRDCDFPPGYRVDVKEKVLLNSPQATPLARVTDIEKFQFFLKVAR
jgi:hypothetical protein